jgi:hypothetical protein
VSTVLEHPVVCIFAERTRSAATEWGSHLMNLSKHVATFDSELPRLFDTSIFNVTRTQNWVEQPRGLHALSSIALLFLNVLLVRLTFIYFPYSLSYISFIHSIINISIIGTVTTSKTLRNRLHPGKIANLTLNIQQRVCLSTNPAHVPLRVHSP